MKKIIITFAALLLLLPAIPAYSAQVRVFVSGMNAAGAQNSAEMKVMLQTLLASRLSSDKIATVESATEADAVVTGTYITIGKIFSVDAIVKTVAGKTVTRAFVQGETENELIPAVGKLAEKLSTELVKMYPAGTATIVSQPNVPITASSDLTKQQQVTPASTGEFIKPREQVANSAAGWLSKRLEGAANLMAIGLSMPDGSREIFMAETGRLLYYRQESDIKLMFVTEFPPSDKIISLDTIAGNDGKLDIYVTIIRSGELTSEVWQVKGERLVQVAQRLPYYFRSITLMGGTKKLYAQAMGRDDDFYGEVAEVSRNGAVVTLKNPIKMPRYGNIYSFNQFRNSEGTMMTAVINPDGYLIVYDQELKELWRSNDKFGGSELYFQKEDDANVRLTGDRYRWIFMNQRIQISGKGDILVGMNDGFWVLGNSRSYKKGAVFCFAWNGSSLEEKWRTRDTQNYMPDYYFDEFRRELLILQTVQRSGITTRGASSLSIKKVE